MELTKPKKKDLLPFAIAAVFFLVACALQIADDYVENDGFAVLLGLIVDLIFFGLLAYWTASVISRVSDKNIRTGITVTISLMGLILFIRFLKYRVFYDETPMRYLWYSYYIPQCMAPAVLLFTVLVMERKSGETITKVRYLLFVPAVLFILLV